MFIHKSKKSKKIKTIIITILMIMMIFPSSSGLADVIDFKNNEQDFFSMSETHTEFKIIPSHEKLYNQSTVTVGIYVTPQDEDFVDSVAVYLLTFSKDVLQATSVTKGNLLQGEGFEYYSSGTISNSQGKITDIFWSLQGAYATESGYFVNITFNIIKMGSAWIKINDCGAAGEGETKASTITGNYTLFAYDIIVEDEYPQNNSIDNERSLELAINVSSASNSPLDIFWYSNMTGEQKVLGYNLSVGNGRHYMSCYGVVDSPYNQTITYEFTDRFGENFLSNKCPGKEIGTIKSVLIYVPDYTGEITPVFKGMYEGEAYLVEPDGDYSADITEDFQAPTVWTWQDIKDLDVKMYNTPAYIIIIYDIGFGYGETVYWTFNVTDGFHWINKSYKYEIKQYAPIITNPYPRDADTIDDKNVMLSADIADMQGDQMSISFWSNKSGSWQQIGSTQNGYNGTYYQQITVSNFSETYWWKVIATDSGNSTEKKFRFTTRDIYRPNDPTNLTAIAINETAVYLSWGIDAITDSTLIKKRTDRFPEITDPGQIYKGNNTIYIDVSCEPGTLYYYSAWNYNQTDEVYSLAEQPDGRSVKTLTYPYSPTNLHAETISYKSIQLTWNKGDGSDSTVIRRKVGSYPTSPTDGVLVYSGSGTNYLDDKSIGGNITYYYRAWSLASKESMQKYSLGNSSDSNTTEVGPPTVITYPITYVNISDITLNGYLLSDGGETATVGFLWGNETHSANATIGIKATDQFFSYKLPTLEYATYYYVQTWAYNTYGFEEGSNLTFCTSPMGTTDLTVETVDYRSLFLEWNVNKGSDKTKINVRDDTYPVNPTDGTTIYFGNETSFLFDNHNYIYHIQSFLTENHEEIHDTLYPPCYSYTTYYINDLAIYDEVWGAQTFTAGYNGADDNYYLNKISLRLWKEGNPGNITVVITNATKVVDAKTTSRYLLNPSWGHKYDIVYPDTENILATSIINGDDINEIEHPGEWVDFEFDDPLLITRGGAYTVLLKAPDGTDENCVNWVKDSMYSQYGEGDCFVSSNSGTSWSEIYYQYSSTWGYQYGRADLNFKCFGSNLTGLESNKTYYFSAWGWNETQGIYSETYDSDSNTTRVGTPRITETSVSDIGDTTAKLHAHLTYTHGESATVGFIYGISPSTLNQNTTITGKWSSNTYVEKTLSGLNKGQIYYYKAWASNSGGYYYDYFARSFTTKPEETTSLASHPWGADQINLSWNKGQGADLTIVIRKEGSYPSNMEDGVERYRGTDDYFIDHFTNEEGNQVEEPLYEDTTYYYRIWAYNESNGFYSTLYQQTSSKTQIAPILSNINPISGTDNADTPPALDAKAISNYGPINVTFWNARSLNMDNKQLANGGSGWTNSDQVANTKTSHTSVRASYCYSYSNYYIRYFAYTSVSGYNDIQTSKLTIYLDQPKLISGIYVSYGNNYNVYNGANLRVDGDPVWHMEYHDFYNDQWILAEYTANWKEQYEMYTDDMTVVDQVRIWLRSTSKQSTRLYLNPRVNYVYFVGPTEIDSDIISSGGTADVIWNDAVEPNEKYYWAVTANDGRTIVGSPVNNFTTERIYFENAEPIGTVMDTETHECSLDIYHSRGDQFNVIFYRKDGTNWIQENTYSNVYNGTYSFTYNDSGNRGQRYYWKVTADDGVIQHAEEYSFIVRSTYAPATPTLTATVYGSERIDITNMYSDQYADTIMLRFKEGSYPADRNDGTLLQNSSASSYIHSGLTPGKTYCYAAWAYNATDDIWSARRTAIATTPGPTVTFKTYAIDRNNINITQINTNEFSNAVMIRYSLTSHPTNRDEGTLVANTSATTSYFVHSGLEQHKQHYYSAWAWNQTHNVWSPRYIETTGYLKEGYTTKPGRTRGPPAISSTYPSNLQEGIPRNPTIQATVVNYESTGPMTIYYRTNASGSWETIGTKTNVADGTHSISTTSFPEQLTWYWYSINVTDGDFWTNQTKTFKTKSIDGPSSLIVTTPKIIGQLDLIWQRSNDAEQTVVVRKAGSYPITPSDGLIIYNGTGKQVNDTGLGNGLVYYYRAWSFLDGKYSTGYVSARGLTVPLPPSNIVVEATGHKSLRISWTPGNGADKTYIRMANDFFPTVTTEGTLIYNGANSYVDVTNLLPGDYLNYFTPKGHTNTIGHYYYGGNFTNSYDGYTESAWDLASNKVGTFSYVFNISNGDQEMDPLQRIYSFRILLKDFYDDQGETWNASITKVETYNTSWNTFWEGSYHTTGTAKQWWEQTVVRDHEDVSEIRFSAWTDYIVANVYEIEIGRLGYTYKFALWSVADKTGLVQMSVNQSTGYGRTEDSPLNNLPQITGMLPTNSSSNVEHKPVNMFVTINDMDGDKMKIEWMTNKSGSWQVFDVSSNLPNGTYNIQTYIFDQFGTKYWWRVKVTDDSSASESVYNTINYSYSPIYHFTTREHAPLLPPSPFNAELYNVRNINLSWEHGIFSDKTYITMKEGAYPSNTSDGTFVYNGTAEFITVTNLKPDTEYYFSAWGWNETDNVYSSFDSGDYATTGENIKPVQESEVPQHEESGVSRVQEKVQITVNDSDGDKLTVKIYGEFVQDVYLTDQDNGVKSAFMITPLPGNEMIFWYVDIFDGYEWVNETYYFVTRLNSPPMLSGENPQKGAVEVSLDYEYVSINIIDMQGDPMDWKIHGNYVTYTETFNDENGTKQSAINTPLPSSTNITWYVNVTDGDYWVNQTYWFWTLGNTPPNKPTDGYAESPLISDETYMDVYNVWLNCTVTDPESDKMDVHYYWSNDTYIGTSYNVDSGATASLFLPDYWSRMIGEHEVTWLEHDTTYEWYAVADDKILESEKSETFTFKTCVAWDVNMDYTIDVTDISLLIQYFGTRMTPGSHPTDITESGVVDVTDISQLVIYFGMKY
jgi:hypothetical protein